MKLHADLTVLAKLACALPGHAPYRSRPSSTINPMRRWLSYIPRFIHNYGQRRQLGQSVGDAFRSARQRTRRHP